MQNPQNETINFDPHIRVHQRFKILRFLNYGFIPSLLLIAGLYVFLDFSALYPLIIVLIASVVPLIFSVYFNKRGKYIVAGNLFGYTLAISLFLTCLLVGGRPAFHNYFLLYAIISLMAISIKQKAHLILLFGTNLLFFSFIEFFYDPAYAMVHFPEAYISSFEDPILFYIFLTTIVLLIYYKIITEKYETMLQVNAKRLFAVNKQLESQTNALNKLNTQLEERQQQIEEQSEVLKNQKEGLQYANDRLEKLIATKDRFFSIIAHDLKNPMGGIMSFSSLLEKNMDTLSVEKRKLYVKNISDSVKKTFRLLEDLLEWARSQNSQSKFKPEKFVLNPLVQQNYQLLSEYAHDKKIRLHTHMEGKAYVVTGDRNMIDTVVRNLMSNAIKFTHPGGQVDVTVYEDDVVVRISVSDTGVGIPRDQQQYLFRMDKSTSTKGTAGETGTGLGLILCKEFVEKNGGELTLQSEEGKGSTFVFTLPVAG